MAILKTGLTVSIQCKAAAEISLSEFVPLQGDLKTLDPDAKKALRNSILTNGISFPFHAWESPEGIIYVIDAHQRLIVLKELESEGYSIPKIPTAWVIAKDKKEAMRKLLAAASQYGRVTSEGLFNFLKMSNLPKVNLSSSFRFPELDMDKFQLMLNDKNEEIPSEEPATFGLFDIDEISADAFKHFRSAGFPYPKLTLHEQKQVMNKLFHLDGSTLLSSVLGYEVADTYHPHRFHATAQNMSAPADSFRVDKKLHKAIRWHLEQGGRLSDGLFGTLSIVSGTQACSNFRPAFAKYLYNKFAKKGAVVFDSSTGYGGRLVGFLASHCKGYIGTDPNKPTYEANCKLADALGTHKNVTLYNSPIEDLDVSKIKNRCDFAFTSPPYFKKEVYSPDDTQSCNRYSEYESWLTGFLKPMLKKQHQVLKKGAANIVNIEDVTIKNKKFGLVEPTIEFAKELGFKFHRIEKFKLPPRTRMVNDEKVVENAFESVIILEKS